MPEIRIGAHSLTASAVTPLSEDEWRVAHSAVRTGHEDHLFFRVGDQIFDATFDRATKLNRAIHEAIAAGGLSLAYGGQAAEFLMAEDVESASLIHKPAQP
jgi:hypothetical protein